MSGRTIFTSSSRSIFFTAAGLLVPSTRTRCCSASTRRVVGSEPRSASSRVSSTSSQTSWSMRSRESRASKPLPSMLFERARRARRRTRRPADGSGISSSIARGAELSGSSAEPPEALAASWRKDCRFAVFLGRRRTAKSTPAITSTPSTIAQIIIIVSFTLLAYRFGWFGWSR